MNRVALPDGTPLPALGLGTCRLGESAATRDAEVAVVQLAIEIGYRVFDTAEMYGEGGAEEVLGRALVRALRSGAATRDQLFVVSKVYPHNASRAGVAAACERSLKRLALDHIDLYLLHWPGPHPLQDTVAGFEALRAQGRIRYWGVSNFDTDGLRALGTLPGGERCAGNQVYYSLSTRGPELPGAARQGGAGNSMSEGAGCAAQVATVVSRRGGFGRTRPRRCARHPRSAPRRAAPAGAHARIAGGVGSRSIPSRR